MELLISVREDGSWVRNPLPRVEASPQEFQDGVASKDVFMKPFLEGGAGGQEAGSTWAARIFLPQTPTLSIDLHSSCSKVCPSLPLILYCHGGGFVFCNVADSVYHAFVHRLAKTTQAVVIAVEYRLAPEHRLPAAHDDCLTLLSWLRSQASTPADTDTFVLDPWLRAYADFSQCYLMGDSAGGNIVHNLSLKLANMKMDPLRIKGHVLIQPFFGGVENTETEEIMLDNTKFFQWFWEHALPDGADRDHPLSNPMSIPVSVYANACLPKTLVTIAHGDAMKDRQMCYFQMLKEAGVDVHVQSEDGDHGFYLVFEGSAGSEKAEFFIKDVIAAFLHAC